MALAWIDETGLHLPDYPTVLEYLQAKYRGIYGDDVYIDPDSQDGQMMAVYAHSLHDAFALAGSVYNSYAPSSAQGVGLSRVVKTNGIRRLVATYSQVPVIVIGQAWTVITRGIAADEAGQRWLLPDSVTIPLSGEITVMARAEKPGDFRAAPGEITKIATPTRGWQSVSNSVAATPGAPIEKDAALRRRQSISTELPSLSIFDGIRGAVASLPGVTRSKGYENDTSKTDANGVPQHSICMVVDGGDDVAIAQAIATKKGPGPGTYGTTAVEVRDKYGVPNIMRFFRPAKVNTAATIVIKTLSGYLASTGERIRQGVVGHINALEIGEDVLASKLYTPINAAEPVAGQRTFDVVAILMGVAGGTLAPVNLAVPFNAMAVCTLDDVNVELQK